MAQEHDHRNQRNGNSSGGSGSSRSSSKQKQKKVPQRGLGVAQLEKIRLEEQQKKDAVLQNNPISPCLATSFRLNPSPQIDLSSSNLGFKTTSAIPNLGFSSFSNQNHVPFSNSLDLGQGSWANMRNGDHILDGEGYRLDPSGYVFRPNANVIYESSPILPASNGFQRKDHFRQQNSCSSMVKVSSGTSSSSSSAITYNQMEPPSNQSIYGKIYPPSKFLEGEKIMGRKRPYPSCLDDPPGPAFPCKFPPVHVECPVIRSVEPASFGNGGAVHVEPRKLLLREGSSRLLVMPEQGTEKVMERKGDLRGDFLSLALPKTALPHPTRELFEVGTKSQGYADDPTQEVGPSFYSFFPSPEDGREIGAPTSCGGAVTEELDLNLKL